MGEWKESGDYSRHGENQILHKHFEFLFYSFPTEFSIRWRKDVNFSCK